MAVEMWTLAEIARAVKSNNDANRRVRNKRIAIPMYQRGQRWDNSRRSAFIDSVRKGYPVGSMLLYKRQTLNLTNNYTEDIYILVDGLQRANCIRDYIDNPNKYFLIKDIPDDFCEKILNIVNSGDQPYYAEIKSILLTFIQETTDFANIQCNEPADGLIDLFGIEINRETLILQNKIIRVISDFVGEIRREYDQITRTEIPVVIYDGDEKNLPAIFDRINSKGVILNQYEVYAAAWPSDRELRVQNNCIVSYVTKKYESFVQDGYEVYDYSLQEMLREKEVSAYEYLFGLGKFLANNNNYEFLGFDKKKKDDEVNTIGFELVNACFNDADNSMGDLYKDVYGIANINEFEAALCKAVEFVGNAINPIFRFKGNNRKGKSKILHSKYQILSMISTTFRAMYCDRNFHKESVQWSQKKERLQANLKLYYVYDIITDYWNEGVGKKLLDVTKSERYFSDITESDWDSALDNYYRESMKRVEFDKKTIAPFKSKEYVILNCISLLKFEANKQLDSSRFDVEHIAPRQQMIDKISATGVKDCGLPISCIANLCYLPESQNRSLQDSTFYQDQKYIESLGESGLNDVEERYSLTKKSDLEWLNEEYSADMNGFNKLHDAYFGYCNNRYKKIKERFFEYIRHV